MLKVLYCAMLWIVHIVRENKRGRALEIIAMAVQLEMKFIYLSSKKKHANWNFHTASA